MKQVREMLLRFLRALSQVFFPMRCPFCRGILVSEDDVCPECAQVYLRSQGLFCATCHRSGKVVQGRCTCGGTPCVSPLVYEGVVRAAILRYKFYRKKVYAHAFTAILAEMWFRLRNGAEVDGVTYVPTSEKSRRERGYDSAQVLAEEMARRLGVPCFQALNTGAKKMSQRELTMRKRYVNARTSFAVQPGVELEGRRLLLCDDIITTGATMERCADLLRDAGAEVIGCAVAHGNPQKSRKTRQKSD